MSTCSPIIITGMHRSGTSMLTRMMEKLGVFVGKKKDRFGNHEAIYFLNFNKWLMHQSGAAWDAPEALRYLLENAEVRALAIDYLRYMMNSPHVVSYLGLGKYLRYRGTDKLDMPWGWKDPRNIYTLPIWLNLYPNAKVLHIYRHGVDVANSLKVRVEQPLANARKLHERRRRLRLYWLRPKRGGFAGNLRFLSLNHGFTLWEAYLREATKQVRRLEDRAIEVKYEDFLFNPGRHLTALSQFCGVSVDDAAIAKIASRVKKDRAYAYRNKHELQAFADKVEDRLAIMGY